MSILHNGRLQKQSFANAYMGDIKQGGQDEKQTISTEICQK